MVYAKNDSKTSNLLSRLSEKLSPYKEILCRTSSATSSEESSCTDHSHASSGQLIPLSIFTTSLPREEASLVSYIIEEQNVSGDSSGGSLQRKYHIALPQHWFNGPVPSSDSSISTDHLIEKAALILNRDNPSNPEYTSPLHTPSSRNEEKHSQNDSSNNSISIIEPSTQFMNLSGFQGNFHFYEEEYVMVGEDSTDKVDMKSP